MKAGGQQYRHSCNDPVRTPILGLYQQLLYRRKQALHSRQGPIQGL